MRYLYLYSIYEYIHFMFILVYLEFVTLIFKNTFQKNVIFFIFTLFILYHLLHSFIAFSYLNLSPCYLNG